MVIKLHVPPHYLLEQFANCLTDHLLNKHLKSKLLLKPFKHILMLPHPFSSSKYVVYFSSSTYGTSQCKLELRVVKCVFVGYWKNQKGYHYLDPITNYLYITIDCVFLRPTFSFSILDFRGMS